MSSTKMIVLMASGRSPGSNGPHQSVTGKEAEAIHRGSQRANKIIQRFREADRRKAAAEYDRSHAKTGSQAP